MSIAYDAAAYDAENYGLQREDLSEKGQKLYRLLRNNKEYRYMTDKRLLSIIWTDCGAETMFTQQCINRVCE